jgi:hypothetical protein
MRVCGNRAGARSQVAVLVVPKLTSLASSRVLSTVNAHLSAAANVLPAGTSPVVFMEWVNSRKDRRAGYRATRAEATTIGTAGLTLGSLIQNNVLFGNTTAIGSRSSNRTNCNSTPTPRPFVVGRSEDGEVAEDGKYPDPGEISDDDVGKWFDYWTGI